MGKYQSEAEAAEAGIHIVHDQGKSRFVIVKGDQDSNSPVLGEGHYTLRGTANTSTDGSTPGSIDFDHTFVGEDLRGTGLAGLLANHMLTSDVVTGREILASCSFIANYLEKHPELAGVSRD